jgi:hypothetical protein
MKGFDWDNFKNDKIVIHCDTLEKAEDFIDRCITHGFSWSDGEELNICKTYWEKCICYKCDNKELSFGSIDFCMNRNDKIIEWELEFMGNKNLTLEQKVEDLGKQIKELKEELYKRKEEDSKKKWWTPKEGEEDYWYLCDEGKVFEDTWYATPVDKHRYDTGNCFKTKEQAEREIFERQLRFKLKKFAYENDEEEIDWNDVNKAKYYIYYSLSNAELDYDFNYMGKIQGIIYFTSKEVVEKAIETFKDDLIRYFTSDK